MYPQQSLLSIIDEIGEYAASQGMTAEILELLLNLRGWLTLYVLQFVISQTLILVLCDSMAKSALQRF